MEQGGIIDIEMPIHVSNVAVLARDGKPTRVGYRIDADGTKVRVCKRTGAETLMSHRPPQPRPRSRRVYNDEIRAQLTAELGLGNVMEVPTLREDRHQRRLSAARSSSKQLIDKVVADLTIIAGQKPVVTKAKKSIAGFKLREGNADRRARSPSAATRCGSSSIVS